MSFKVHAAICLDPRIIFVSVPKPVQLFEKLLHCVINAGRVSARDSDTLKREYENFKEKVHGSPKLLREFKNYDKAKDQRIDDLLALELKEDDQWYQRLWALLKCVLVLSHGQAGVEGGFSDNPQLMDNNFKEKSNVALRTINDHIKKCGVVLKVKIVQCLRSAAKSYSANCKLDMKEQRKK